MPKKEAKKKLNKKKQTIKNSAKVIVKPAIKKKQSEDKTSGSLQLPVYDFDGKINGKISLPKEIFGTKINRKLLAQAVRVNLVNRRSGNASTKTRGEVEGSTRKIYRQKGTGKARHGAIRAPIFVGGGIVFGPKPKKYHLDLTKKMRQKAVLSALSLRYKQEKIKIIRGLESIEPKTKILAGIFKTNQLLGKTLLVVAGKSENVIRAAQNLDGIMIRHIQNINAYDLLVPQQIVFMQEAFPFFKEKFVKSDRKI